MERNSPGALPGALRAPGAFCASGTSDQSCDSLNLLALHHARLLSRSGAAAEADAARGRAGASGSAATFLSMRVCHRSVAIHARLLARSGAAAFEVLLSTGGTAMRNRALSVLRARQMIVGTIICLT
jgi:hypothetical protein